MTFKSVIFKAFWALQDCGLKSQNMMLKAVFWRKCCREGEQKRSGRLLSQRHFLHSRFLLRSRCLVAKLSQQIFGFHCYWIRSQLLPSWSNTMSNFVPFVILLFTMLMWLIQLHATPYSILLIRMKLLIGQIRMGAGEYVHRKRPTSEALCH